MLTPFYTKQFKKDVKNVRNQAGKALKPLKG
jgi:hypothetical protein